MRFLVAAANLTVLLHASLSTTYFQLMPLPTGALQTADHTVLTNSKTSEQATFKAGREVTPDMLGK